MFSDRTRCVLHNEGEGRVIKGRGEDSLIIDPTQCCVVGDSFVTQTILSFPYYTTPLTCRSVIHGRS